MCRLARVLVSLFLAIPALASHEGPADISVEVSASPAVVDAGQEITYAITMRNSGPGFARPIKLSNPVPANTQFIRFNDNHPSTGFSCEDARANNVNIFYCSGTVLQPNESWTVFFTVRVNADAAGLTISSTATASGDAPDPNSSNNSMTVETPVTEATPTDADISVTKMFADMFNPYVGRGEVASFTITVRNGGPIAAQNVTLTDVIPAETTFESVSQTSGPSFACTQPAQGATGTVSCSIASLADGAVATFALAVRVGATTDGEVFNTATVSSSTPDPDTADRTSTDAFIATRPGPDLKITKTASPAEVVAGESIYYIVEVENVGSTVAIDIRIVDAVPANTTFRYAIHHGPGGGVAGCGPPEVNPSGAIECTFPNLSPNVRRSFEIAVRVNSDAAGETITNTATVSASTTDPDLSNNSDTVQTPVSGTPPSSADLAVGQGITEPEAFFGPGEVVPYEIFLMNNGLAPAQDVSLTGAIPAGATFESLTQTAGPTFNCTAPAHGATGTVSCFIASFDNAALARFTLAVRVNANATGGTLSNTVDVASSTPDPNSANNSSTSTVTITEVAGRDLILAKSADPAAAEPGDLITYTVTATNIGSEHASVILIKDPVPANTTFVSVEELPGTFADCFDPAAADNVVVCRIGGLGPSESHAITFTVRVNDDATGVITNTATVETSSAESNVTNNSATAETTLPGSPDSADLEITKTADADTARPNANVTYTITISNYGPSAAGDIVMTDELPEHTTFVSVTDDSATDTNCFAPSTEGDVQCFIGTLPAGHTRTISLVLRIEPGAAGSITNTATVESSRTDPNLSNNSATVTTPFGRGRKRQACWVFGEKYCQD